MISGWIVGVRKLLPEIKQVATVSPLQNKIVLLSIVECGQQLDDVRVLIVTKSFQSLYFCSKLFIGGKMESFES